MAMTNITFDYDFINENENLYLPFRKYHLSTDGYYFWYRPDKYDGNILRATLYKTRTSEVVDDVMVSAYAELNLPEKSHHDVINYFEARLTLNIIS